MVRRLVASTPNLPKGGRLLATTSRTSTQAQTQAINRALDSLGFMQKAILTDLIKKLPDALVPDELPEKMMGGIRQGMSDDHLLVATNLRLMLVNKPSISFSGKLKVKEAAWDTITAVEWKSGLLAHHLVIRMGRKKWDCEIPGIHGKGKGIEMSEFLETKLHPSPQVSRDADPRVGKYQAIERMVYHESIPGSAWKKLPSILGSKEMPEILADCEYDDRNGLKVASGENKDGLLTVTDRRLLFVANSLIGQGKVWEFAFEDMGKVESSKGLMRGAVSIDINGRTEIFRTWNAKAEQIAQYLTARI